uniref:Rho-GAP domain-containing protein n=2 Tax=Globodera pallida TaxID=36090 RepID=A0A183CA13_GLOPA
MSITPESTGEGITADQDHLWPIFAELRRLQDRIRSALLERQQLHSSLTSSSADSDLLAQNGNVSIEQLLRAKIDELERKQKADQVEHQKLVEDHKTLQTKMEQYQKQHQQTIDALTESAADGVVRGIEMSGSGSAAGTSSSSSANASSSSVATSANTSAAATINEVVDQLCKNVSELRMDTEPTELGMQQPQTTSTSVVVDVDVDDHLQQREADEIGVEPAPVVTANHQNGSGNNEADELAKLRFGIVERVEIAISSHGLEVGQKIWVRQPCQRKRMDRRCKTKAKVNNAAATSTKRTSGVDAGAEQGKRLHRRADFGQVMVPLMRTSQEDPIYRMCLQLPGMPIVTARLIFQINQFLCQFIAFIPKEALGEINNKHSFTLFNTSIVKKALQERETPQLLEDKMMSTLATTVKYAQNYAQCQEGISYAMRTFQNVAEYLEQV